MEDIQVQITNNNPAVDVSFGESIATNIAVHNTNKSAHANVINDLFVTDASLLSQVSTKAEAANVPTKVSELENDSNFATVAQIPEIPTNVSQLVNDSNFTDTTQLATKANKELDNLIFPNALTNLGFAGQLLSSNGYYKFPNGLIIQWGEATTSSGTLTVTLPTEFTTTTYKVLGNSTNTSGTVDMSLRFGNRTTTTFYCRMTANNATVSDNFMWVAIGY